jgi:hypothetical protein
MAHRTGVRNCAHITYEDVPSGVEITGDGRSELNGYMASAAISSSADV